MGKHWETKLGHMKSSLEIANADNVKLLGQLGSAEQERDAFYAVLEELKKAKDKTVDEAEDRSFKKAEESYTKQVKATKDIFFQFGWKAACEKLGQELKTEVFTSPPPVLLPDYMMPYANDIFNSLQDDEAEKRPRRWLAKRGAQ